MIIKFNEALLILILFELGWVCIDLAPKLVQLPIGFVHVSVEFEKFFRESSVFIGDGGVEGISISDIGSL